MERLPRQALHGRRSLVIAPETVRNGEEMEPLAC